MTEDWMRRVVSQLGAQEYLIGFLLKYSFRDVSADDIPKIGALLKEQVRTMPDSVTAAFAGNDHLAERFSDLVVLMQQQVDKIVDEAVAAAVAVANKNAQGR